MGKCGFLVAKTAALESIAEKFWKKQGETKSTDMVTCKGYSGRLERKHLARTTGILTETPKKVGLISSLLTNQLLSFSTESLNKPISFSVTLKSPEESYI